MNPLTPAGNESQEAARARELADVVHKTKLGSHTDHAHDAKVKTFDTAPTIPSSQPRTLPQNTQNQDAKVILQNVALKDLPTSLVTQPSTFKNIQPVVAPSSDVKKIERISENTSLTSQSAVLHTLTQDVQSLVKDRKVSMVRAIALESDAHISEKMSEQPRVHTTNPSGLLIALTCVCIVLTGGIVATAWYIHMLHVTPKTTSPRPRYDAALVFYEHSQPFDITDLSDYELMGGLAHLRDTVPSSLGSMTSIDMYEEHFDPTQATRTSTSTTLTSFISAAHLDLGDTLLRALSTDYMVLIHQSEVPTPVLLMRATEPDAAFAGMLAWEPRMSLRLSPLFPRGTLTLADTAPTFTDISFNNIDARILYDNTKKIILVYALLERNVIAITNSLFTMQEVAQRLHTQRLKK